MFSCQRRELPLLPPIPFPLCCPLPPRRGRSVHGGRALAALSPHHVRDLRGTLWEGRGRGEGWRGRERRSRWAPTRPLPLVRRMPPVRRGPARRPSIKGLFILDGCRGVGEGMGGGEGGGEVGVGRGKGLDGGQRGAKRQSKKRNDNKGKYKKKKKPRTHTKKSRKKPEIKARELSSKGGGRRKRRGADADVWFSLGQGSHAFKAPAPGSSLSRASEFIPQGIGTQVSISRDWRKIWEAGLYRGGSSLPPITSHP